MSDCEAMVARRKWNQHHKALRKERLARARARGTHTPEQWEALILEVGGTCVCCRSTGRRLVLDHIVPLYQSDSSDGIDNVQPLCRPCNSSKGSDRTNWLKLWRAEKAAGIR